MNPPTVSCRSAGWRRTTACALAAAALCCLGTVAFAQMAAPPAADSTDPSEAFLKAYTSVQQGDNLAREGNSRAALSKYRFAATLLDQLTHTNPNWQPLIVRYRLRNTTDAIKKLEEKGGLQAASPSIPTAPAASDDDLPAADPTAGPVTAPAGEAVDRQLNELKNKLGKTQSDLKNALDALNAAKKDKQETLAASKKDKEELTAATEKEKQASAKERANLDFQAQSARAAAASAQKRFEHTKADRDDLAGEMAKAQDRLKEIGARDPDAVQSRKELRDQIADLKKQLTRAQTDTDSAAKNRQAVDAKFADNEAKIASLTQERDAAVTRADLTSDAAHAIEKLQGENADLTGKLATANGRIAELTQESVQKKEDLDNMQKELGGLREQLTASRDQNDRSATTITELRQQLDDNAKQLAQQKATGTTPEEHDRLTKENELLRGIVTRQLKDQARRIEARKLMTDELARLDVQSVTLNSQVEALGRPSLQLTDEERALFKDPQVALAEADNSSSMAVEIARVKPRPGKTPADDSATTANPSEQTDDAIPDPGVADNHAPSPASNTVGMPKVETTFQPRVSEDLLPMAREAKEDFDRGRYTDAELAYQKLLSRDPKNPYLLSNQGVVLFRQDKLKSAEVVLRKAIAVTPKDAFCLSTLGIVYYRMHHYDDALIYLTQAIQLDPKNATAHNYLGITSSQKGWPEAAIEEVQKAITLNPNYADAHFNLAVIYATNQPPAKDRALDQYRMATSLGATPDPALEKMLQK